MRRVGDALTVSPQVAQALVRGLETRLFLDATQPPLLRRIDEWEHVVQERVAVATTEQQLVRGRGFQSLRITTDAKGRSQRVTGEFGILPSICHVAKDGKVESTWS